MATKRFGKKLGNDELNAYSSVGRPTNKKKFRMPASLTIILGILVFVIALTWMYPSNEAVTPVSFGAFGGMFLEGFASKAGVIFYLFVLGAFIEVLLRTKTLERGIAALSNKLKNKIVWSIPILFVLFSLGGTLYGMQEETLGFFIILVPFFVAAGFDTMTALLVILLGTTTGFAFSIINPFSVGVAYDAANVMYTAADLNAVGVDTSYITPVQQTASGNYYVIEMNSAIIASNAGQVFEGITLTANSFIVSVDYFDQSSMQFIGDADGNVPMYIETLTTGQGFVGRTVLWVVATAVGATFVTWYGRRVYRNNKKSWVAENMEADLKWAKSHLGDATDLRLTRKHKATLIIMGLAFGIMILGFIPWPDILGYEPSNPWWVNIFWGEYAGGDQYGAMGWWYWGDLITVFLLATVTIMIMFRFTWKQMIATIFAGAKEMFSLAILIGIAAAIGNVLQYSGLTDFWIQGLSEGLAGMETAAFLIMIFAIFAIMALAIPSTSGLATAVMPLMSPLVIQQFGQVQANDAMGVVVLLFSVALGAINMFIPTQAVVMAQADASRVGYAKMAKVSIPYAIGTLVFTGIIVIPTAAAILG